jgi:hypothetical protein
MSEPAKEFFPCACCVHALAIERDDEAMAVEFWTLGPGESGGRLWRAWQVLRGRQLDGNGVILADDEVHRLIKGLQRLLDRTGSGE